MESTSALKLGRLISALQPVDAGDRSEKFNGDPGECWPPARSRSPMNNYFSLIHRKMNEHRKRFPSQSRPLPIMLRMKFCFFEADFRLSDAHSVSKLLLLAEGFSICHSNSLNFLSLFKKPLQAVHIFLNVSLNVFSLHSFKTELLKEFIKSWAYILLALPRSSRDYERKMHTCWRLISSKFDWLPLR